MAPVVGRRIAAADQHGLAAQQARGIVLADAERGQVVQGGLDGKQQALQRVLALLLPRLSRSASVTACASSKRSNARAPQRDEMAEAAERAPHVAGERAHVGALAAAGLEDGRIGVRHVDQDQRFDLHQSRLQLDDLAARARS